MSGEPNLRHLKITVVGDGVVGKTWLLKAYLFPEENEYDAFVVFENYHAKMLTVDGVEFSLTLWDTPGQEAYEQLRALCYPKGSSGGENASLMCLEVQAKRAQYLTDNTRSVLETRQLTLTNEKAKWLPELRNRCPRAAIIIVGTKSDLRDVGETISEQEGKKLKSKIKANGFLQCSAKTREGLEEVFVEAVRAVMKNTSRGNKSSVCKYL